MTPSVCVIGAGPSGLATLKNLKEAGLEDVVCYEAGAQLGGNWVLNDAHGHSSIYETTHTISSKKLSQFEDFPMPGDYPEFPSHRQILEYFEAYAAHFDVERFIRYRSRVETAKRDPDGRWRVTVAGPDGEETARFDHLFVCSGHHWDPIQPEGPEGFTGEQMHSHAYKSAAPFRDKRVLVVGGGNTACDIAVETSRVSRKTCISLRRGYYIVPKIVFGMPLDVAYGRLKRFPKRLRQIVLGAGLRLAIGRWSKYRLQPPDCRPLEMHPTLNSEILYLIRHGKVHPRGGIASAAGRSVTFADGKAEEFDTIVWATGYRMSFPFLGEAYADWAEARRLPLYLKMMPVEPENLYFIGLVQPIGCIWTLADHQARIAAGQIAGRLERPKDIERRVRREMARPHWRFQDSPRHAIEVDYHQYRRELLSELRKEDVR